MELCQNIARQLEWIRKARGLSLTEFSDELGIARSSLQSILNGTANPRADTIEHIAEALDLDPVSLLLPPSDPRQAALHAHLSKSQLLGLISEMLREDYESDNP